MQANYSRRMNGKEVSVGGEIYVLYPFPAFTAANLSGELAGRLSPEDITVYESQGLAVEDLAAGNYVFEKGKKMEAVV